MFSIIHFPSSILHISFLWKYVLRARGMMGFTFNRQRPVLNYIADFMCKELMLVIEVDGITHQDEDVIRRDRRKTRDLERVGFKVIRFEDDEVLRDIESVAQRLEHVVKWQKAIMKSPSS